MKIKQIFRDKAGNYSLREIVGTASFVWILISAAAEQFWGHPVNNTVFITFAGILSSGIFGYSLEKFREFTHKPTPVEDRPPFQYPVTSLEEAQRD